MSQHHKPRRHTLLPFSPLRQSTLSLSDSTIFQFLFPFSFFHYPPPHLPASVSSCIFLILTFLHSHSRFTLSSITRGLYFLKLGEKRQHPRHRGKLAENPTLTSILSSPLTLFLVPEKNFKEPLGAAGVWSPGEHQRTVRHTRTSARPETVQEREV